MSNDRTQEEDKRARKMKQQDERLALILLVAGLLSLVYFVLNSGLLVGLFLFVIFAAFTVFVYKEGDSHGEKPLMERLRNVRR